MDIKDIEYIYAVYCEKSFSRAAEKLFITQPALSFIVKKVENSIGVPIFDRRVNPIKLTHEGEYYIECIKKILDIQREMEDYFRVLKNNITGDLKIGAPTYFCTYILPSMVQAFKKDFPDSNIELYEANDFDLTKYLQSGVIDVCITVEKFDGKIFDTIALKEELIILAVPASLSINDKLEKYRLTFEDVSSNLYLEDIYPPVSMRHFEKEPFLFQKKGNDMYKRGLEICKNAGFIPNISMYLDQLMTSYYVALAGKGIAFIRSDIASHVDYTDKLYFYKIDDKNTTRTINVSYKKNDKKSNIMENFLEFIDNYRVDMT